MQSSAWQAKPRRASTKQTATFLPKIYETVGPLLKVYIPEFHTLCFILLKSVPAPPRPDLFFFSFLIRCIREGFNKFVAELS